MFPRVSFVDYTNELSEKARHQEGFISSNSYWKTPLSGFDKTDNDLIIISISEWKNMNYWNQWFQSNERTEIYDKHKHIVESEDFSILKKKIANDDMFLL